MGDQFKYLFSPLKIGPVTVKNRLASTAHVTVFSQENLPTEKMAYYHAERAKGGVGLIITELTAVHPTAVDPAVITGYDERAIPGFRLIADRVHEYGTKIIAQISHTGRQSPGRLSTKLPIWSSSSVISPRVRAVPHIMTVEEIREVKEGFVKTAANIKAAGYDGIEIQGCHGYLISQFMSPFTNHRNDLYGGSLENRLRFPLEVINAIRVQVGKNMVVGIRISGDELVPGGLTLDDMREIAVRFEGTEKLDYVSVSAGINETYHITISDMSVPLGVAVHLAAGIKEVVRLPVFACLRINDPVQAEQILAEGKADMIGMCRALICDPELPNKAREGRLDDIRKCMACNQECRNPGPICCTLNAITGFEKELGIGTMIPASTKKKVVIIGGGPGGLEAARVSAIRGHHVTLYEQSNELGGQVNIASKATSRADLAESIRYLSRQVTKLQVNVKLGIKATRELILEEKPDAVVVATGSLPSMRDIPGATEGRIKVTSVHEVLEERGDIGNNIVIFDYPFSFWQCCATGEYLAKKGKKVTIITPFPFVGMSIPMESLNPMYDRLFASKVTLISNSEIKSIKDNTLVIYNIYNRQEQNLNNIDSLVLSLGGRANDSLYHELKGNVKELYAIGDCVAPRKIPEAIREGHIAGRRI